MARKDVLLARRSALGWSEYRVVQEVCKLRQARGDQEATVVKYQSSINKAFRDPDNVKVRIVDDIIEAMGGEQVIRWNNPEEVVL